MSAVPQPSRFPDAKAYLAWEEKQQERHEYVSGQTYAIAGTGIRHNTIALNAALWLRQALRGTPCRVNCLGLKLRMSDSDVFVYPDVMVTSDLRDRAPGEDRYVAHPWFIAEVFNDSSEAFDRGPKFELYRKIDALTHYLLIDQNRRYAELFEKSLKSHWVLHPKTASDSILVESLRKPWPVSTLYDDVDFTPPPAAAGAT